MEFVYGTQDGIDVVLKSQDEIIHEPEVIGRYVEIKLAR